MSIEPSTEVAVHKTVSVPLAPERAFALFTARMTEFWPPEHHIGDAALAEVVMEPQVGGRWFERGVDGRECEWGRVAEWQPPDRLVLLWQLGANWQYDPDLTTEVEVTFTAEPAGTRLDLRHRHLERYGERAQEMYAAFDSPDGWTGILDLYAGVAGRDA